MPANPIPNSKEIPDVAQPEGVQEQETSSEQHPEAVSEHASTQSGEGMASTSAMQVTKVAPPGVEKDALYSEVEQILSEDLGDVYKSMAPGDQLRFKIKGEETAQTIHTLIQSAGATARKVLGLILTWLKMIPGVNKFFLEQESKIKTDEIMTLVKKQHDEKSAP